MGRARWNRWGKRALKAVLGLLVLWAVGRHVAPNVARPRTSTASRCTSSPAGWRWRWCSTSAGLALLRRLLRAGDAASPTPVGYLAALRAYLISHLGKYVPGKAMVVVMRVGLVAPYGARPATAAFATLYETLVMMAAGGAGRGARASRLPVPVADPLGSGRWSAAGLVGLALGLAFLVRGRARWSSPGSRRLISVPFPSVGPEALPRISQAVAGRGLALVARGLGLAGPEPGGGGPGRRAAGRRADRLWPVVVASVALATVAGFVVAVLPGGLGVREGVLMTALAPALGRRHGGRRRARACG